LAAIERMAETPDVASLAAELGVDRGLLYKWNRAFEHGGVAALRLPGERAVRSEPGLAGERAAEAEPCGPTEAAPAVGRLVAALERKVAQQGLELDFFRAALQHFAGRRRPGGGSGGTGSTP
jgi:transposase-like protein